MELLDYATLIQPAMLGCLALKEICRWIYKPFFLVSCHVRSHGRKRLLADVVSRGSALDAPSLSDARAMGVQRPESILVLMVDYLPLPSDGELQRAA